MPEETPEESMKLKALNSGEDRFEGFSFEDDKKRLRETTDERTIMLMDCTYQ